MESLQLKLVVAAEKNRGIGLGGSMPWKLRKEFKYFTQLISRTKDKDKKNVLLLGRKTWDSVAPYQPLHKTTCINIVISKTLTIAPEGVYIVPSFEKGLEIIKELSMQGVVENNYVLGGAFVYKMALESEYFYRLYYTNVMENFKCDIFFPEFNRADFIEVRDPEVPEGLQVDDNGVIWKVDVLERRIKN